MIGDVEKYNPNPSRGTGSIRNDDRMRHSLKCICSDRDEKRLEQESSVILEKNVTNNIIK